MFNRGKRNEDSEDDLSSLRGGFADEGDDDSSADFLDDITPERGSSRSGQAEERTERRTRRRGAETRRAVQAKRVGLIGGCLQVIGIALLSLLIFLLIGFGIAFGAQAIGAIDMVDLSAVALPSVQMPEIALFSTPLPSATPTDLPPSPMPSPTAEGFVASSPTPDISCPEMALWWEDHAPIYEWFASQSVEAPPRSIPATLEQMRIRREAVATAASADCINGTRNAFVAGYDQMIIAFQILEGGDLIGSRSLMALAGQAFADGYFGVWNAKVNTTDSPLAAGVSAGSGNTCGASAWYDAAKPQRSTFVNAYLSVDVDNMAGSTIRQQQNAMIAALDSVRALSAPPCATIPARDLIGYLDDLNFALQYRLGDNPAEFERMDSAWRNQIVLDAWLRFMGIEP